MEFLKFTLVRMNLARYFRDLRIWAKEENYACYSIVFGEFKGYIRSLMDCGLMSESVYDSLFDIANDICFF